MKIASLVLAGLAAFASTSTFANDTNAEADWQADQARLAQSLAASTSPRDRMLSASLPAMLKSAQGDAVLAKAAAAAPDDVLVQWMAAVHGNEAATAALPRLEPDNAAAWLPALRIAIERRDDMAIDSALGGFAAGTRVDDHYGQLLHAWQDALRRQPDAAACDGDEKHCVRAGRDFTYAVALTAASVFPAVAPILTFCKATPGDSPRRRQCEAGGHVMFENGNTQVSSAVGFALLRGLDALTPADEALRRRQDWLRDVTTPLHRDLEPGAPGFAEFMADWTALDSEFEVMRRLAQRAGQPLTPPDGWVSPGQRAREAAKARGEP